MLNKDSFPEIKLNLFLIELGDICVSIKYYYLDNAFHEQSI